VLALLRRNRAFRTVFLAQVISYAGDWFATVALIGLVRDESGSDLGASLVFVAQALPAFFTAPLAGPVADRFDRRAVMVTASSLQIIAAGGFFFSHHGLWLAFAAQASISALGAFFAPASQAAIPNLVDEDDLATATTLMAATWGTMLAIGAGLGGVFTVLFGRTAAFAADLASFAIAGALIMTVRRPMRAGATAAIGRLRPIRDTAAGLRYARGNPTVMALLASKAGFGLSSGLISIVVVLAEDRFATSDGGTGMLLAVRGIGVVVGPLLARRFMQRGLPALLTACGISAIVNGAAYSLVPWVPALALVALLVLVAHLGGGTQWLLSTYGLQVSTPDELRGRIFATDFALVTLSMSLSLAIAGIASDALGARPVMAVLGGISLLWGVVYLALTRRLRVRPTTKAEPAPTTPAGSAR
jgi:MFS family permease